MHVHYTRERGRTLSLQLYQRIEDTRLTYRQLDVLSDALTCSQRDTEGRHLESDHIHDPQWRAAMTALPMTEYDRALAVSQMLGSDLIYMDGWQIWDGTAYVRCGEEWPRRAVARYAEMLERTRPTIKNLKDAIVNDIKNRQLPTWGEDVEEVEDEYKGYLKMVKELKSDRGNKNVTSLMQITTHAPYRDASGMGSTLSDFLSVEMTPALVEGLLPGAGLGQMYGESYIGKTFAAVDLACSVASGRSEWLGHKINAPGRGVLYVAAEGGDPIRKMFQGWIAGHHGLDPSGRLTVRDAAAGQGFSLTDPAQYGLDDLKRDYDDLGRPSLIVIDPQADVTGGVDENSKALADALRPLAKWANEAGCFVLLVHHAGKDASKGARGSSAQRAMMDVQIEFTKGNGPDSRVLRFTKVKGERLPDKPFELEFRQSGGLPYLHCVGTAKTAEEEAEAQIFLYRTQILNAIKNGHTSSRAIAEETKIARNRVNEIVQSLTSSGVIHNTGSGTRPRLELVD